MSRNNLQLTLLLCLAGAIGSTGAIAAGTIDIHGKTRVQPGERLSDWLLRNAAAGADKTALHWRVPSEQRPQDQLRRAVLGVLEQDHQELSAWLTSLPLTGRLPVAHPDARWLQAAPAQDPVLQDGQTVLLMPRPKQVTLLSEGGRVCSAEHVGGARVADYVRACWGEAAIDGLDSVWVAQPDGKSDKYGLAPWNETGQNEPGPGSWVWAPKRTAGIPDGTSGDLSRFLATQLPAEFLAIDNLSKAESGVSVAGKTPQNVQMTASDWGELGLLQTPSARMEPSGTVRLHLGRVEPYTRGTVMLQPLDWLEAGFRYTDISNRLYGPEIAGLQSYKDKSFDVKVRLRTESDTWPQFALGIRDVGGTGLFAGEYLVASKRWGQWDTSLGLGWGYLAGDLDSRTGNQNANGGTTNFQDMFSGRAAVFGGVQWQSPDGPWLLKAELEGNRYRQEPQSNNQTVAMPLNLGVVYRYSPYVDLSLALERGNRFMVGFTLHGALDKLQAPKLLDPELPRVGVRRVKDLSASGWADTAEALELHTRWAVQRIAHQGGSATIWLESDSATHLQERIDRAAAVLDSHAPATTDKFVLNLQEHGIALSTVTIDRNEWTLQNGQAQPPSQRLATQDFAPSKQPDRYAEPEGAPDTATVFRKQKSSGFSAELVPSYSQILGGPNNFLLYQIGAQAKIQQRLSQSTRLTGVFNFRLLDNYENFVYDAPSELPRVRTFQREYATASRATMPELQLTDVTDLGNGNYGSVYLGMLEPMYGGVGGEWLYRPWQSPLALGVDLNRVQQRDFAQNFHFRDYIANTGHATLYWDTGWNDVQINLSAGQYLAGDTGATLDVKRVFNNGVELGAWATKTNVSADQFGEGSFDKGIYVKIPFDVLSPRSSSGSGTVVWNPLTRDGGARLNRSVQLYEMTQQRDRRAWTWRSAEKRGAGIAE